MEAIEIGEQGSSSMALSKRKLAVEDYLDLLKHRHHQLNYFQLQRVILMHGFGGSKGPKSILLEAVKTINLMDLRRSTLNDSSVSGDACLNLDGVIRDLNDLQWQECHVTSLISQGAAATATKDRTVPGVNRNKSEGLGKKPVKVDADDSIVSAMGTTDAGFSTSAVKFKRLSDLGKDLAADDDSSIIPTPGTTFAAGSTTLSKKGRKSKGLGNKPIEIAADGSIIPTKGTTVAAESTTVSEREIKRVRK